MTITVLVTDDNAVVRAVVREMLHPGTGINVVGEAGDGAEALRLAASLRPEVTLLDHRMPARDGLSVVSGVSLHSRVLMMTRSDEDDIVIEAVRSGASGFLVHGQFGPAELVHAIRSVAAGGAHLSPGAAKVLMAAVRAMPVERAVEDRWGLSVRERQVMGLIAQGHSNGSIARRLVLAPKTVENHVNRIYAKLGANDRDQAIGIWNQSSRGRR